MRMWSCHAAAWWTSWNLQSRYRQNMGSRSRALVTPVTATFMSTSWRTGTTATRPFATKSSAQLTIFSRKCWPGGGVITGEHGIGLAKKRWWPEATSPVVRDLHRRLKQILDPDGILNPGKFV